MLDKLNPVDLSNIQDENARELIVRLMNLIEAVSTDLRDAQAEIQRLRDENNRLKGEQGKPNIKGNKAKPPQSNYSSEQERRKPKPRRKRSKKATIKIHREQTLEVNKASLPEDAEFKGYEDVVVQDVIFRADNVRFHKEKYWAYSTGKTYLAKLPLGYEGQFGPGLKALALTLYFGGGMSEAKIRDLYENVGVQISAGQVSNLLIKSQEQFHAEKEEVCEAGLGSTPWQHTDQTSTRVDGQNQHCYINDTASTKIYTFWYHPMEPTSGHLIGFFYMFLLLLQSSLFYTRVHLNRYWTTSLEVIVLAHGALVAVMNGNGLWPMFAFGFGGIFVITQMHGLGLSRWIRWLILALYVGAALVVYGIRGIADIHQIFWIPVAEYLGVLLLAGIFGAGLWISGKVKGRQNVQEGAQA